MLNIFKIAYSRRSFKSQMTRLVYISLFKSRKTFLKYLASYSLVKQHSGIAQDDFLVSYPFLSVVTNGDNLCHWDQFMFN